MMKNRQVQTVFSLILLGSCATVVTRQEVPHLLHDSQKLEEGGELFEVPQDFEGLDLNITMARTKKMHISIKDLPFYTKIFCSYLYEEKIKKWYQSLAGYLGSKIYAKASWKKLIKIKKVPSSPAVR